MPCVPLSHSEYELKVLLDPQEHRVRGWLRKTALLNACAIRTSQLIDKVEPGVRHCLVTGKAQTCEDCSQPVCLFNI